MTTGNNWAKKPPNFEPLPVDERARNPDMPAGLKNIGNSKCTVSLILLACYFASLLQVLFFLPNIQEKILSHDPSTVIDAPDKRKVDDGDGIHSAENLKVEAEKLAASKEVVAHLQTLFAEMLQSNRKYADPTRVLEAIVDDHGGKMNIYEQKDIGEFFQMLLERVQDGLGENKELVRKLMGSDLGEIMKAQRASGDGGSIDLGKPMVESTLISEENGSAAENTFDFHDPGAATEASDRKFGKDD